MKIISTILYGIFILCLVSVAGLFLATLLPIPGNVQVKIVKSGSMEPTILTGSIVIVKPQNSYAVNDVITFGADSRNQIPTTHRIVASNGDFSTLTYTTKGDANEEQDQQPVTEREIIGKVVFWVPYAGFILDFARQPLGFTLMIGIPASIIILDELIKIGAEMKRMRGTASRRREDEQSPAIPYEIIEQTRERVLDLRHL